MASFQLVGYLFVVIAPDEILEKYLISQNVAHFKKNCIVFSEK